MNAELIRRYWLVVILLLAVFATAGCEREQFDPDQETEGAAQTASTTHQYSTRVDDGQVTVGEADEVRLQILPATDLKINLEFPWSIRLDSDDGLELKDDRLEGEELVLSEERAEIPIRVEATEAAEHRVRARANFSVCNDDRCYIFSDESVEFVVQATQPDGN